MAPTRLAPSRSRVVVPLLPPVLSYAALTLAAAYGPELMAGEAPGQSDHTLLDFFRHHADAAHASAFLTLGAAIPLAVATAVATTRLRTLGLDVPGRIIAMLGGAIASSLLALAGLSTLAISRPHVADSAASVRALYGLTFAAGGPGFVAFAGLLVAGLSITGLIGSVLPRWIGWAGIVVAAVRDLASFSAAFTVLDVLLPIARFGAAAWLVAVGFSLPATRRELRERRGIVRAVDAS
jgi:hypothetical protein